MCHYSLPTPFRGATHVQLYEVRYGVGDQIVCTLRLGSVAEGEQGEVFVPDPDLRQDRRRVIEREELADFYAWTAEQGAASKEYRDPDLAAWLATHGIEQPEPREAAPVEQPAPPPPPPLVVPEETVPDPATVEGEMLALMDAARGK